MFAIIITINELKISTVNKVRLLHGHSMESNFFFIKILLPTLKKHICVSADTKKKESILHKFQKLDLDKVVDINFLACSYELFNSKNYGF